MNDQIRYHIVEALNAIIDTPEEYKKIAFEVILNHLLSSTQDISIQAIKRDRSKVKREGIDIILKSSFDLSSTNIFKLKPALQNLYILKVVKEKFGIDGLSPNDIQTILLQKFRISKTPNAISMSLMNEVGKHIDRIQEGREFSYRITENGIEYLNSEIKKIGMNHYEF